MNGDHGQKYGTREVEHQLNHAAKLDINTLSVALHLLDQRQTWAKDCLRIGIKDSDSAEQCGKMMDAYNQKIKILLSLDY